MRVRVRVCARACKKGKKSEKILISPLIPLVHPSHLDDEGHGSVSSPTLERQARAFDLVHIQVELRGKKKKKKRQSTGSRGAVVGETDARKKTRTRDHLTTEDRRTNEIETAKSPLAPAHIHLTHPLPAPSSDSRGSSPPSAGASCPESASCPTRAPRPVPCPSAGARARAAPSPSPGALVVSPARAIAASRARRTHDLRGRSSPRSKPRGGGTLAESTTCAALTTASPTMASTVGAVPPRSEDPLMDDMGARDVITRDVRRASRPRDAPAATKNERERSLQRASDPRPVKAERASREGARRRARARERTDEEEGHERGQGRGGRGSHGIWAHGHTTESRGGELEGGSNEQWAAPEKPCCTLR